MLKTIYAPPITSGLVDPNERKPAPIAYVPALPDRNAETETLYSETGFAYWFKGTLYIIEPGSAFTLPRAHIDALEKPRADGVLALPPLERVKLRDPPATAHKVISTPMQVQRPVPTAPAGHVTVTSARDFSFRWPPDSRSSAYVTIVTGRPAVLSDDQIAYVESTYGFKLTRLS
jgi:hypothetical protein